MSEYDPGRDPVIDRNYLTSDNVRARFLLYELTEQVVDFDALLVDTIFRNGDEDLVDIGAADGSLLSLLGACAHEGLRIGVEPNIGQATGRSPELSPRSLSGSLGRIVGQALSRETRERLIGLLGGSRDERLNIVEGTASNIPLGDNAADVVTAMFMFYHIPEPEQKKAFDEVKRVLRPDGVLALATSGLENKLQHRLFEQDIASHLGNYAAPTAMNCGFNTDRAEKELPNNFEYVYLFKQQDWMVIDNDEKVEMYINSLRSLRDQFEPVPSVMQFELALDRVVRPKIQETIAANGRFVDIVQRSVAICSDAEQTLDPRFEQLSRK